jgi:HEPN domain-containing protein
LKTPLLNGVVDLRKEIEILLMRAEAFKRDAEVDYKNGDFDISMYHLE